MTLKKLIEMAMAPNQSKKEFAKQLDITPEYLSRICNEQNKPSKQLLKEISEIAYSPQVTYKQLLQSANYPLEEIENPLDIGKEIVNTINKQKVNYIYPVIESPIKDPKAFVPFMNTFLKNTTKNIYLQDLNIVCILQKAGSINDGRHENYISGKLHTHTDLTGKFPCKRITIPFVILGHWSLNNKFYIEKISFKGKYLKNILPPTEIDILYEDGCDIDCLPYIIYVEDIKEQYKQHYARICEELFGKTKDIICSDEGLGFYLDKFPPKLFEFIENHKDQIENLEDPVLKEKISHLSYYSKEEIEILLEEEDTHSGDAGWQATIANIMKKETGYRFTFWAEDDDVPQPFRTKPVILISHEEIEGKEKEIKNILAKYAKELGLDKFAEVHTQFIGCTNIVEYPVE